MKSALLVGLGVVLGVAGAGAYVLWRLIPKWISD